MSETTMQSALDRPLTVTTFPDEYASRKTERVLSLRQIADGVQRKTATSKAALPWLKLASFGDVRTDKGSLRHNANVLSVDGIEGDHDASTMQPEDAQLYLESANVAALIYTSPSHTDAAPRWRVLCPVSASLPPDQRKALVARLNGVLSGGLASESFKLSQSYYFGSVGENPAHRTLLAEGRFIDEADDLDADAIYPEKLTVLPAVKVSADAAPDEHAEAAVVAACALFDDPAGDRHQRILAATAAVAPYVLSGHLDQADAVARISEAVTASGREPNAGEVESALQGALAVCRPYEPPTGGSEFPAVPASEAPEDPDAWRSMLLVNAEGRPFPISANVVCALRHAPAWRGVLGFNLFSDKVVFLSAPPYATAESFVSHERTDDDDTSTAIWMQHTGIRITSGTAKEALTNAAKRNAFHPVKDYLSALEWDGTGRIDTALTVHLGVEDTTLNRAFSAKTLIGAVARIYEPGCLMKTVLTLEGNQDLGKSTFARALCPDDKWFTEVTPDIGNKDALQQLRGIWIQEHAELATLTRADAARVKAFISQRVDRYRPSFGRNAQDFPRECIFIASVNPGSAGYLRDETGNTRFWPVTCAVGWDEHRTVDGKAVTACRDQIWAEAVVRFRKGEHWWLAESHLRDARTEAAAERSVDDAWGPTIREFIDGKPAVTTEDVRKHLGISTADWSNPSQQRVGNVLRSAGWMHHQIRVHGKREWAYVPADGPDAKQAAKAYLEAAETREKRAAGEGLSVLLA